MKFDNSKFHFSIVLYVNNGNYEISLRSIINQNYDQMDRVQLLVIPGSDFDPEGVEERKILDNIRQQFKGQYILLEKKTAIADAYRCAESTIEGSFVNYMECGSEYAVDTFSSLKKYIEETEEKTAVLPQLLPNSLGINRYVTKQRNEVEFHNEHKFPFIFFQYCFIPKDVCPSFDYKITHEDLFLIRSFLDMVKDFEHVAIMQIPCIQPSASRKSFELYFEDYQANKEYLKQFRHAFMEDIIASYGDDMPSYPVQYTLMILLEWCVIRNEAKNIITKVYKKSEFKKFMSAVLNKVSDQLIVNKGRLSLAQIFYLMKLKYGREPEEKLVNGDIELGYGDMIIDRFSNLMVRVDFVEIKKELARIMFRQSYVNCEPNEIETFAVVNGKEEITCKPLDWSVDTRVMGDVAYKWQTCVLEVPLDKAKCNSIQIFSRFHGYTLHRNHLAYQMYSPIVGRLKNCYYYHEGHVLYHEYQTSTIHLDKASKLSVVWKELKYLVALAGNEDPFARKAIPVRLLYHLYRRFKKRPIWLISDRTNKGDDNGEAFIKYLNSINCKKDIDYYFVIEEESEEGKRMAEVADIISPGTRKHKLYHLLSQYIISSQANPPVVNPLNQGQIYYRDLLQKTNFVFLQHGVTKDNQSSWLRLYNRNIFGLVVTTNQEYKSMFEYDYFYEKKNIWLTGMPRNDLLYHDEKKYITLMPTWRKTLMTHADPVTGIWQIRDDFKESDYYQFYNNLLNSEKLTKAAQKYGYKICFKCHPNIEPYLDLFDYNEAVYYMGVDKPYREVFAETDLLVTDYSSVAFDFAYLRKPVVYCQYDKDTFFSGGHSYTEGYFNYLTDGFGPVTGDLEETIDTIIHYMENDCVAEEEYLGRINNTFCFNDKFSSKRVYENLIHPPIE